MILSTTGQTEASAGRAASSEPLLEIENIVIEYVLREKRVRAVDGDQRRGRGHPRP